VGLARLDARDAALRALPPARAAAVIEAGYDYLNFRRTTGISEVPDGPALARELLVARSEIDAPSQAPRIEPGVRPDEGHGTARVSAGAGRRDRRAFLELGMRASYHDILDDDAGYIPGAQIEFFKLRARRYEGSDMRIESLIPVEILSLSPRDEFFQPKSFRVGAGWRRTRINDGSEPLQTVADGALGGTWATRGGTRAYAMLEASARVHHRLDRGYALGAGPRAGALIDPTPRWRLHAYAQYLGSVLGERDNPRSVGLRQRLTLAREAALRLDLSRRHEGSRSFNEASLALQLYF
jgi:hypothetical protein